MNKVSAALGRCQYAGCREYAVTADAGYVFCRPCYFEHLALLREEASRSCPCGLQFVSTHPARRLCDACRKSKKKAS